MPSLLVVPPLLLLLLILMLLMQRAMAMDDGGGDASMGGESMSGAAAALAAAAAAAISGGALLIAKKRETRKKNPVTTLKRIRELMATLPGPSMFLTTNPSTQQLSGFVERVTGTSVATAHSDALTASFHDMLAPPDTPGSIRHSVGLHLRRQGFNAAEAGSVRLKLAANLSPAARTCAGPETALLMRTISASDYTAMEAPVQIIFVERLLGTPSQNWYRI